MEEVHSLGSTREVTVQVPFEQLTMKIKDFEIEIESLRTRCRQLNTENDWERYHAKMSYTRYLDTLKRIYNTTYPVPKDQQIQELQTLLENERSISPVFESTLDLANDMNVQRSSPTDAAEEHVGQKDTHLQTEASPRYGILLLDGNEVQFSDKAVGHLSGGGEQSARRLMALTEQILHYDFPLIVRICIYGDLLLLNKGYSESGVLKHQKEFRSWVTAFNTASPWVEIVDVGSEKDAAKMRVQQLLHMHLSEESCRGLILGGEINDSTMNILSTCTFDDRVKLVTESVMEPLFRSSLPAGCLVSFDNLFRSEPLPLIAGAIRPRAPVTRDDHGRRIDPRICVNQSMVPHVSNQKLCNNKYLRGGCTYPDCRQNHTATLSEEEMTALIFLGRCLRCRYGSTCTDEDCHAGHNCPRTSCNLSCQFPRDQHLPGTIQAGQAAVGGNAGDLPWSESLSLRQISGRKRRKKG